MIIYWLEHFLTTQTATKTARPSLFCAVLLLDNYGHQPNICIEIYITKATSQLAMQCKRTTNFDKCIKFRDILACVASVSLRGSTRKLGQEQKKMNDGAGGGKGRDIPDCLGVHIRLSTSLNYLAFPSKVTRTCALNKLTDLWITSLLLDLKYKFIYGSFAFSPG